MKIYLQAVEGRLKAATPEEWAWEYSYFSNDKTWAHRVYAPGAFRWPLAVMEHYKQTTGQHDDANFALMASAPTDLAKLVEMVRVAVEALERVDRHGCCAMHSDVGCPGCEAHAALAKLEAICGKD